MMKAYGKYAQERNGAWKALVDCEIDYLPVDVIKIAYRNKIRIYRNSEENVLGPDEMGACVGKQGHWGIVYDDTVSNEERRYTVAHELGHIFLGHDLKFSRKDEVLEAAADSFAQKLLTPLCVLKELGVTDKKDIAKLCDVPDWVAIKRATRLKQMINRDKFYTSNLEIRVREVFSKFIAGEKQRKMGL